MSKKILTAILLSLGGFIHSTVVMGQDFSSVYSGNGLSGLITNQTAITQTAIGKKTTAIQPRKNTNSTKNLAALSFKPSISVRNRNLAQFIEKIRATNPALAQKISDENIMDSYWFEIQ